MLLYIKEEDYTQSYSKLVYKYQLGPTSQLDPCL